MFRCSGPHGSSITLDAGYLHFTPLYILFEELHTWIA